MKIYIRNIFGVPFVAPQHQKRLDIICNDIINQKPNIAFFEEFFLESDISFLKELESEYTLLHSKHDFFDVGGGLVALVKKGIDFTHEYVQYKNSGFLTDMSIVDKFARKGFQVLHLTKKNISFIHTHLTCAYGNIENENMSNLVKGQLQEISTYIQNLDKNKKICVCGDLNLEPENQLFKNFIKENYLIDNSLKIKRTYIGNFYVPHWLFQKSTNAKKIDYFLSKNFSKTDIEVHTVKDRFFASDHKALIVNIV